MHEFQTIPAWLTKTQKETITGPLGSITVEVGIMPAGTTLYHGTGTSSFTIPKGNSFFGLSQEISMMIVIEKKNRSFPRLLRYVTKTPIKVILVTDQTDRALIEIGLDMEQLSIKLRNYVLMRKVHIIMPSIKAWQNIPQGDVSTFDRFKKRYFNEYINYVQTPAILGWEILSSYPEDLVTYVAEQSIDIKRLQLAFFIKKYQNQTVWWNHPNYGNWDDWRALNEANADSDFFKTLNFEDYLY